MTNNNDRNDKEIKFDKDIFNNINLIAYNIFKKFKFAPDCHKRIRKNPIWKLAKIFHIVHRMLGGVQLKCDICNDPIWGKKKAENVIERYSCVLHHKDYDFQHYFSLENCQIIHKKCHKGFHDK